LPSESLLIDDLFLSRLFRAPNTNSLAEHAGCDAKSWRAALLGCALRHNFVYLLHPPHQADIYAERDICTPRLILFILGLEMKSDAATVLVLFDRLALGLRK
jgi:hypothetical protein